MWGAVPEEYYVQTLQKMSWFSLTNLTLEEFKVSFR